MRIARLYLRNYRVYEQPVELEIPPGLVGIYGLNGSGKSTLIEAIPWALYGVSRTAKDEVRTAGVNADCVVEVEFEHEGHLYLVRRTLAGANATARAEAWVDRSQVTASVRDTTRYVHSVLGMDDDAFRASVFAEQKHLAAFSERAPARRRDLVLSLLGITPLDAARDQARRDARARQDDVGRLRGLLSDLGALEEEVAGQRRAAEAAGAAAAEAAKDASVAREELDRVDGERDRLEGLRRHWERLVDDGRRCRAERDQLVERCATLEEEDRVLADAEARLPGLEAEAAALEDQEARLRSLDAALAGRAEWEAAAAKVPAEPSAVDPEALAAATREAEVARSEVAGLEGRRAAAVAERDRAAAAVAKAGELSGEADCPLCGQALGTAFEAVQAHRAGELADAEATLAALTGDLEHARARADGAQRRAGAARAEQEAAEAARGAYERAVDHRAEVARRLEEAVARAVEAGVVVAGGTLPGPEERRGLADAVARARAAGNDAATARGRLERRPALQGELSETRARLTVLEERITQLRDEVRGLSFRPADLEAAEQARSTARQALDEADRRARAAEVAQAQARARVEAAERQLAEGQDQHRRLAELGEEARHLGRTAELLASFRNAVVGAVGPRLSAQAAELFGELTDHEYDQLEVDPETYEIRIRDQGVVYGMSRYSGSETDLANLALRVAISEQVRFQSGGAVGLLVLDEVFGPLDDDRKERMLLALERLRGRFRQVLVVTHASDVKEQLPSAVEVAKLPGRRASARLV